MIALKLPTCRMKYPRSKVECGPPLDLMRQDSVKAFADAISRRPGPLNILVNNAGLGYTKKSFTDQNVGMLTQVRRCCSCGSWTLLYHASAAAMVLPGRPALCISRPKVGFSSCTKGYWLIVVSQQTAWLNLGSCASSSSASFS